MKFVQTSVKSEKRPPYPRATVDLSIVVVNWNTQALLQKCLDSVYTNLAGVSFEIWVVDNDSIDGSTQMVQKKFPEVKLIENRTNLGFAQANNQAIRRSRGRYILLLNPDTEVMPGALQELINFMDALPQIGAAGPRLVNPDGTLQTSCYPTPTLLREFWRLLHLDRIRPYGIYAMHEWDQCQPRDVEVVQGACLILRKEALDGTGFLNEDYFIYSEEVDLCYRLKKAGWSIFWLPEAAVIHHGGQSTQLVSEEMFLHLYQSKVLFFRRNYGRLQAYVYKLILLLAASVRLSTAPLAGLFPGSQTKSYREITQNYRRLLLALPRL